MTKNARFTVRPWPWSDENEVAMEIIDSHYADSYGDMLTVLVWADTWTEATNVACKLIAERVSDNPLRWDTEEVALENPYQIG